MPIFDLPSTHQTAFTCFDSLIDIAQHVVSSAQLRQSVSFVDFVGLQVVEIDALDMTGDSIMYISQSIPLRSLNRKLLRCFRCLAVCCALYTPDQLLCRPADPLLFHTMSFPVARKESSLIDCRSRYSGHCCHRRHVDRWSRQYAVCQHPGIPNFLSRRRGTVFETYVSFLSSMQTER